MLIKYIKIVDLYSNKLEVRNLKMKINKNNESYK